MVILLVASAVVGCSGEDVGEMRQLVGREQPQLEMVVRQAPVQALVEVELVLSALVVEGGE